MFLNIFLQFILYIKISLTDINPIKNYYSMIFYDNFSESNIEKFAKILLKIIQKLKNILNYIILLHLEDLIKNDISNIDIDNKIEFVFIIKMEKINGK